jgi:lysozyme family protein
MSLMDWLSWRRPATTLGPAPAEPMPPAPTGSTPATASISPARFGACLPIILAAEGGFVNDPRDPGGATNHGITYRTLAEWRGAPVTVDDVRTLTTAEAGAIYQAHYWTPLRCDALPRGVDLMAFDFGVNAGVTRSARLLQACVGLLPDGMVGPATIRAAFAVPAPELIGKLADERLDYYRRLPTFAAFGKGWASRVADVKRRALAMAGVA